MIHRGAFARAAFLLLALLPCVEAALTNSDLRDKVSSCKDVDWDSSNAACSDIADWDVSAVTNMSYLFADRTFNLDISGWDTSSVLDMSHMFDSAWDFNQDLSGWNVSSVTDMSAMFNHADSFDQSLGSWDTSSVTTMSRMFEWAIVFNDGAGDAYECPPWVPPSACGRRNGDASIAAWNVGAVTDMAGMFKNAFAFDQDLQTWDTSSVVDMNNMFASASAFNGDVTTWDTSAVTDMSALFYASLEFNQNLASWNTSAVTDMTDMFRWVPFNAPIGQWDTSRVQSMAGMFGQTAAFNQPLANWDVSAVSTMLNMFFSAEAFDGDLSGWDTSAVTNMRNMFYDAESFNQDISSWNTAAVVDMANMFNGAASFDQDLCAWDLQSLETEEVDVFGFGCPTTEFCSGDPPPSDTPTDLPGECAVSPRSWWVLITLGFHHFGPIDVPKGGRHEQALRAEVAGAMPSASDGCVYFVASHDQTEHGLVVFYAVPAASDADAQRLVRELGNFHALWRALRQDQDWSDMQLYAARTTFIRGRSRREGSDDGVDVSLLLEQEDAIIDSLPTHRIDVEAASASSSSTAMIVAFSLGGAAIAVVMVAVVLVARRQRRGAPETADKELALTHTLPMGLLPRTLQTGAGEGVAGTQAATAAPCVAGGEAETASARAEVRVTITVDKELSAVDEA